MAKRKNLPPKFQVWVDARKRFRLTDTHIQMAREMGMNPKKFGSLANHDQEKWKAPLPIFIESLYFERFGKDRPNEILSIEAIVKRRQKKQEDRRARKESRMGTFIQKQESNDPF